MNYKNKHYYEINLLIQNDYDLAIQKLNNIDNDDISLIILKLKAYSKREDHYNKALTILNNLPKNLLKKRIYIQILKGLIEWDLDKALQLLLNIYKKFDLTNDDIKDFFNKNINYDLLFDIISYKGILLETNNINNYDYEINDICPKCGIKLIKKELNNQSLNKMINVIESTKFNKYKKKYKLFLLNSDYNIIIDGANILYSYNGNICNKSIKKLENLYNECILMNLKPLIIAHKRHKKILNKFKFDIYYTPYNINDDLFIIYGSLLNNLMILTNDKFRDHIYHFKNNNILSVDLNIWKSNKIVNYNNKLLFSKNVSHIAQKNENIWHLPLKNGKWICCKD
tara:strand:- start:1457 stop:2479 length:1023 start_codon:yes stop_codon:yes gene_type:complete